MLSVFKPAPCISGALMLTRQIRHVGRHLVTVVARPVSVYPGSSAESVVYIDGSGVRVLIATTPTDNCIQVNDVAPVTGTAPLQVRITITVSSSAKPGIYGIDVAVMDPRQGRTLASVRVPVYVLGSPTMTRVVEDIGKLRRLYKRRGIQYSIVYALNMLGMSVKFSDIKLLYQLIVGRKVSNGSVADLLKRLLKKGVLKRVGERYHLVVDFETAMSVMDVKRAANGVKGALKALNKESNRATDRRREQVRVPRSIEKVLRITKELMEKDYWKAVDFVAHTIIGARRTGTWILWFDDYFIYRENKTGFLHYFKSKMLSEILKSIGLREGFMVYHVEHSAEDIIRRLYRSYANARRLHYELKEIGWLEYGEPLVLETYYDAGSTYLAFRKLYTGETLVQLGDPNHRNRAKRYLVYGGEHVDEENEEFYHYRPSGLY